MRRCRGITCRASSPTPLQPKTRRVLRSIYGNDPYVEGWAQYITQTMLDEGLTRTIRRNCG